MKKLFFAFALMGIVSSAYAGEYSSFLQCVQAFHNDQDVLNQLNYGNPAETDAIFTGIKDIVKSYDTPEEQYNAITSVEKDSEKYSYEAYRNYVLASMAMLQYYVAINCPEYFIHFIDYYSTDVTRKLPKELAPYLIAEEVDGKQQIKLVSADEYNNSQSSFKRRQYLSFNSNLAGGFYMLLLPTDLGKNAGDWLTYEEGKNVLRAYKNQSCGDGWYQQTRMETGIQRDYYFVDVIDHVNIHNSFPGLLVPMTQTIDGQQVSQSSIAVRDRNNAATGGETDYIGVNNYSDNPISSGGLGFASENSKKLAVRLKNSECTKANDFSVYIASPKHPLGIVDEYIGKIFNKIVKKDHTEDVKEQQSTKNMFTYGGVGVAVGGGLMLGALGLKAWFGAESAKAVVAAKAGTAVAGGFLVIGGIVVALIGIFKSVADAFSEMEEPLAVTGYDRMFIYYKVPLLSYGPSLPAENEVKQVLKYQEVQATSGSSDSLAVPVMGTPAKSKKTNRGGW